MVTVEDAIDEPPEDEARPNGKIPANEANGVILEEADLQEDGWSTCAVTDEYFDDDPPEEQMPGLIDEDEDEGENGDKFEGEESSTNKFEIDYSNCVLNDENMEKLKGLCTRYANIFSKSEKDLGRTTLVYHEIKLTTDRPIAAPNYRTPPPEVQRDIIRETDKLISAGCIRESNSPYNAPIVLVRKKCGGWRYC